jgi:hypothetical protein
MTLRIQTTSALEYRIAIITFAAQGYRIARDDEASMLLIRNQPFSWTDFLIYLCIPVIGWICAYLMWTRHRPKTFVRVELTKLSPNVTYRMLEDIPAARRIGLRAKRRMPAWRLPFTRLTRLLNP